MFILTSALDYAQITLIENCESSHQIIDKLDSIYLQRSESGKMIAHERFYQYRMKDSDSVAQHIANVENLAKKLKDIGETVSDNDKNNQHVAAEIFEFSTGVAIS
ncbi:hypothetical protein R5R35_014643 [Gryllus longicercus]|uniref:Uncharacterized protein n=1 Tax=Gryllus longicercus TaxID=2509291 RepID=A0AAN9VQT8_9ORTH